MSRTLFNVFMNFVPCSIGFPLHIHTSDLIEQSSHESNTEAYRTASDIQGISKKTLPFEI